MLDTNLKSPSGADTLRLSALVVLLKRTNDFVRFVDYGQAQRDCEQLAVMLLKVYSRQELDTFSFIALPRGGLIVLGMLSYILDLQPSQLVADLDSTAPLVIVDDCAITGRRFADFLDITASSHIVFAHLYSHPDLRKGILTREPRVNHCIAAHDLVDHARELYTDLSAYQAWQQKWRNRLGSNYYWIGQTDIVCFPWSEPDHPFWNELLEREEDGWRFLPPHRCLKNKSSLGLPPKAITNREWQVASSVVTGSFDGVLWLCQTETGQVYSLQSVAADIWRCLAVYGNVDATVEYMTDQYEIEEDILRGDVIAFAEELFAKGLIEKID